MTDAPNPVGRPSLYRPHYCDELVQLMSTGLSLTASMGEMGFTRRTAHDWAAQHPEFSHAIALGHAKRSAFLERKGISAESGPAVTFAVAALKNCNPEDFREKQALEVSGPDGGAVQVVNKIERVIVRPKANGSDA